AGPRFVFAAPPLTALARWFPPSSIRWFSRFSTPTPSGGPPGLPFREGREGAGRDPARGPGRRSGMFPVQSILAIALLTTPNELAEICDPPLTSELYSQIAPTLQSLAVQWEILDPRETRYVLIRFEDFPADLKLIRRRYEELADAPPLVDCKRFPD